MKAVVVVGMSVREVVAGTRLRRWAEQIEGDLGASVAHLQVGDPPLTSELTRLADAGAERITLVGVSLGTLAPGQSWLRRIAGAWWRERGESPPRLEVATRLVSDVDALAAALTETRPITGAEPGLSSPAWESVPRHRHQVLLCRGPRCTAAGSDASAEALVLALMAAGLGDDDVLLTHTGCLFPCNQAPVVAVQPDDVWYGGVDADTARAVVAGHLVAGEPLVEHRLTRRRRTD